MSDVSTSLQNLLENYQPDRPDINRDQFKALPLADRLYYALMYPRYFQLTPTDENYFDLIKQAYNILLSCEAKDKDDEREKNAEVLIKNMVPSETLPLNFVHDLIRDTKAIFGRIVVTDTDYDRAVIRRRLWDLADRARGSDDYYCERLAIKELIKLDGLAVTVKKDNQPVIPELPEIEYTTNYDESDAAIIIASEEKETMD